MKIPAVLKIILARTVYRVGNVATILAGPSKGLKYRVFADAGLSPIYGGWEPEAQALMMKYIRPGFVAYDVGANYGVHTLLMARLVEAAGEVCSFEPVTSIAAELEENVRLNRFRNVRCISVAVSDRSGQATFETGHHVGAGRLVRIADSEKFNCQVSTITLDEFVSSGQGRAPNFIKIDVEGAESAALEGARKILKECRPVILVDLHNPDEDQAVGNILLEHNYDVFRTKGGSKVERLDLGWPAVNGIWGQVIALPR